MTIREIRNCFRIRMIQKIMKRIFTSSRYGYSKPRKAGKRNVEGLM
jgi:hypothetical protein